MLIWQQVSKRLSVTKAYLVCFVLICILYFWNSDNFHRNSLNAPHFLFIYIYFLQNQCLKLNKPRGLEYLCLNILAIVQFLFYLVVGNEISMTSQIFFARFVTIWEKLSLLRKESKIFDESRVKKISSSIYTWFSLDEKCL